jgi:hypothetical protein
VYWRGSVALAKGESYEIVVAQPPDMAQVDAAILTNDMIHHWNPRALLLVGVAGSASDGSGKDEPRLGDLVVARDVYYYERGKVTAQGKAPEPTIYRADPVLLNNVINMPPMTSRIAVARPDGRDVRPVVHQGVIASGEKVIADAAARDVIARDHRKISAIEMEGYGFSERRFAPPSRDEGDLRSRRPRQDPGLAAVRGSGSRPIRQALPARPAPRATRAARKSRWGAGHDSDIEPPSTSSE